MDLHVILLVIFALRVLVAVFSQSTAIDNEKKLELVQVLFRHGERTPLEIDYEALHYTNLTVYEPFGLNQLTNNGKNLAYNVGLMLRERYNGFIHEVYNQTEIFAQSGEPDRMQMSLQLALAGLYSPRADLKWNPRMNWSPIPYRYAPEKLDVLFMNYKSNKFTQLLNDAMASPEVVEKLATFKNLRKFLENRDGVYVSEWPSLMGLSNTLLIHTRMNISLPNWYTNDLLTKLKEFVAFYADCMSFTPEMKRIISGPLVKTFWDRMNVNETLYNPRKMYLYSGSDVNVGSIARALKIDGIRYTDFSDAVILEKFRDSEGQLYVKVRQWNAVNGKIIDRTMGECDEFCPINDFWNIIRDVIPSDKQMNYLLEEFYGQNILELYTKDPMIGKK